MVRLLSLAAAGTAALLLAAPAQAEQLAGYYAATPATAPQKTNFITRSTVWKCAENSCVAARAPERDMVICQLVARELGALATFSANGAAFDPATLEKCNTRAK